MHVSSLPSSVYTVPSCLSAAAKKSHTKPKNISDGTRLLSQQLPQAAIAFANTAIPSKEAESANSARGEIKASWQLLGTLHKKASSVSTTEAPPTLLQRSAHNGARLLIDCTAVSPDLVAAPVTVAHPADAH